MHIVCHKPGSMHLKMMSLRLANCEYTRYWKWRDNLYVYAWDKKNNIIFSLLLYVRHLCDAQLGFLLPKLSNVELATHSPLCQVNIPGPSPLCQVNIPGPSRWCSVPVAASWTPLWTGRPFARSTWQQEAKETWPVTPSHSLLAQACVHTTHTLTPPTPIRQPITEVSVGVGGRGGGGSFWWG